MHDSEGDEVGVGGGVIACVYLVVPRPRGVILSGIAAVRRWVGVDDHDAGGGGGGDVPMSRRGAEWRWRRRPGWWREQGAGEIQTAKVRTRDRVRSCASTRQLASDDREIRG